MDVDFPLAVAGLFVGFVVGLTGMGGGALMTPMLVLLFNVQPLAAVSSDLVASFVMKPVGGGVHLRRGTVNLRLAAWLCVGSIPAAFVGVLLLRVLGDDVDDTLKVFLGAALAARGWRRLVAVGSRATDRARRSSTPALSRSAVPLITATATATASPRRALRASSWRTAWRARSPASAPAARGSTDPRAVGAGSTPSATRRSHTVGREAR